MGSPQKTKTTKKSDKRAHHELESQPTKVDAALESADLLLTTAQNVGEVANIPFLGNAAGLARSILTMVQQIRDNKSAFEQVASEAYEHVKSLTDSIERLLDEEQIHGKRLEIDSKLRHLNTDVEKLVKMLTKVENFAHIKLGRSLIQRILYWRADSQTIREFRDKMTEAHRIFMQSSTVAIRFDVSDVKQDLKEVGKTAGDILERIDRQGAGHTAPAASTSSKLSRGVSGRTTYVNSMVNSGNVSTTTHNGNVINVGSPQSNTGFMPPYGPFHNHQIASSPFHWSHQMH